MRTFSGEKLFVGGGTVRM